MKTFFAILSLGLLTIAGAQAQTSHIRDTGAGLQIGFIPGQKVGFHGTAPAVQRSGAAQTAVTITPGKSTLTLNAQVSGSDSITIGSTQYIFKTSISGTTTNQILIGGTLSQTIANTVGAINASTAGGLVSGSNYFLVSGSANASALAATGTGNTIIVTALASGTAGNGIATTGTLTSGSNTWSGSSTSGGLQADVNAAAALVNELRAALVEKGLIKGSQ